jgi:hypothetical protein
MSEYIPLVYFVVAALLIASVKVIRKHERLVVFRLGHLVGPRGPGLRMVIPLIEHFTRIDLRMSSVPIELHEVVTRDDIILKIDAVCFFHINNPIAAVTKNARDASPMTEELVKSGLHNTIRESKLEELERVPNLILRRLGSRIDRQIAKIGMKVNSIQIKSMQIVEKTNGHGSIAHEASGSDLKLVEQILDDGASTFDLIDFENTNGSEPSNGSYQFGARTYSYGNLTYKYGHDHFEKRTENE